MASISATDSLSPSTALRWPPVLVGLAVLYGPTFIYFWKAVWSQDDHAYGLLVIAVCCWIFWRDRSRIFAAAEAERTAGWLWLAFGLLVYILGRSQRIYTLEMGSLSLVLAGALLVVSGRSAFLAARFPLFYMLFMLPLPAPLVDAMTGPLKQMVSVLAHGMLYEAGYPIARSGVLLMIDQYQLLVADACSGLHSMFSLTALGVLYMYMMGTRPWWRNAIISAAILPIAFFANVIRVMLLVLVTYYFGDEAGQGFVHGFAGFFLFMAALAMLTSLDTILDFALRHAPRKAVS